MPIIELDKVSKGFGKKILFENVNLSMRQGESCGFIGENGSGKSVLFKLICGLEKPTQGTIKINGKILDKDQDYPDSTGIVINEPNFIPQYSGIKNLSLLAKIQDKITEAEIITYMKRLRLNPEDKTSFRKLSTGTKQKLALCQAIMEEQQILLFDEPFNGLDYASHQEVKTLFDELKAEGRTILMTNHNRNDLAEFCDKLYQIDQYQIQPIENCS